MSTRPEFQGEAGARQEGERGEEVRERAQELGAEVRERGHELREELGRLGQQAKEAAYEQVEHRTRQLEDIVQEQPLRSVLIAAGIGFVLGVMWSRD